MEKYEIAANLRGSLLKFMQCFFKFRTGVDFRIGKPLGREPHQITLARNFNKIFYNETPHLLINIPPGFGKTEFAINSLALGLAINPCARNLYISYSYLLACTHTEMVRDIITCPEYRRLFPDVEISKSTSGKGFFKTTRGGWVYAAGVEGTITGMGAGIQGYDGFGGMIIGDDLLKSEDAYSDTMRAKANRVFKGTIYNRKRNPNTPIVIIQQRLHEDDLSANLLNGYEGHKWESVILKGLDENDNALDPKIISKEDLLLMKEHSPEEYWAKYQQEPQAPGGSIFKREWFKFLDTEPEMIATFITVDGAETDKTYNDATVFSFFGVYKIVNLGVETGTLGVHCINCVELFVEPKDLPHEFLQFYAGCCRHPLSPEICAIENKSAGVTLITVVRDLPGLRILSIERGAHSGSKVARHYSVQRYISRGYFSLPTYAIHTRVVVDHMIKLTATGAHRRDDIGDTISDALTLVFIDRLPILCQGDKGPVTNIVRNINRVNDKIRRVRNRSSQGWQSTQSGRRIS